MAKYWWGSSIDKRSLHWLSWDKLEVPKVKGGMDFRNMQSFNLAMLGKHGWRLLTRPDFLCARVLKGKYYPHTDFLNATVPAKASATWKAIVAGREALQVGLIRRVGDGSTISIWNDKWIPGTISMSPVCGIGAAQVNFVADLIDPSNG